MRAPRRAAVAALALAAALSLTLTGCISWFLPPEVRTTSTPAPSDVSAELQPFYSQVLRWTSCGDGMQCTTATAPMNWADPAAATIDLALVRQPATSGTSRGSLLVNPGGPGGSGYDFILDSVDYATSARLQRDFDVVGFDPRGVGRSSAVSCYDDPAVLDAFNYGIVPGVVGSDEWIAASEQVSRDFGASCLEHTGPLLQYVDTVSAARDLDLLRSVLGDAKLNYLGFSYGTFLGATYADLFPENTGRLVLDGALDPATSDYDVTRTQASGFESAFRAYLADCIGRDDCPFVGTVDQAEAQTAALLDRLAVTPIPASDGRELGATAMFFAIILPLYNQSNWPYLDQLFADVAQGGTDTAFLLADSYFERNADGSYASNSTEALVSVNCLDYTSDDDVATMRAQAAELAALAPVFGPRMAYGGVGCANWPFTSTRERAAIAAEGSSDILVVGTTNDPATPYVWAEALASELQNGHLITYTGEGHTAYNKSNDCILDAVDDYFLDGTVPAEDPRC